MIGLFVMLVLVLLAVYLNDSWRSLERARVLARNACERHGLQFLDGSVIRTALRVRWESGQLRLNRSYRFEFTADGVQRQRGHLAQRGSHFELVSLDDSGGGRVLDLTGRDAPDSGGRRDTE